MNTNQEPQQITVGKITNTVSQNSNLGFLDSLNRHKDVLGLRNMEKVVGFVIDNDRITFHFEFDKTTL